MDNSVMENNAGILEQPVSNEVNVNQATEKMLPQSTVNELIGHAKREAAEKAAQRAVEEYKRSQPQAPVSNQQQAQNQQSRHWSEDDIARIASDRLTQQMSELEAKAQQKSYEEAANRIVQNYNSKIAQGREKYQDFDAVTANLDMGKYPNVVQLLADYVDNSSDVLYELARNRTKLKLIENLGEDDAQSAIYEMKRLSESIKANDASTSVKTPNAPLSQKRPSNTGADSGALTMADLKRKYTTAKRY
jgi:hypothetical protein